MMTIRQNEKEITNLLILFKTRLRLEVILVAIQLVLLALEVILSIATMFYFPKVGI